MPEGGNVPFQVLRSEKQWKTKGNCKQAERECGAYCRLSSMVCLRFRVHALVREYSV